MLRNVRDDSQHHGLVSGVHLAGSIEICGVFLLVLINDLLHFSQAFEQDVFLTLLNIVSFLCLLIFFLLLLLLLLFCLLNLLRDLFRRHHDVHSVPVHHVFPLFIVFSLTFFTRRLQDTTLRKCGRVPVIVLEHLR